MNTPLPADERLTPDKLWSSTIRFVCTVLPDDVDTKMLNQVAVKVYEQMKFLVADPVCTVCNRFQSKHKNIVSHSFVEQSSDDVSVTTEEKL